MLAGRAFRKWKEKGAADSLSHCSAILSCCCLKADRARESESRSAMDAVSHRCIRRGTHRMRSCTRPDWRSFRCGRLGTAARIASDTHRAHSRDRGFLLVLERLSAMERPPARQTPSVMDAVSHPCSRLGTYRTRSCMRLDWRSE